MHAKLSDINRGGRRRRQLTVRDRAPRKTRESDLARNSRALAHILSAPSRYRRRRRPKATSSEMTRASNSLPKAKSLDLEASLTPPLTGAVARSRIGDTRSVRSPLRGESEVDALLEEWGQERRTL